MTILKKVSKQREVEDGVEGEDVVEVVADEELSKKVRQMLKEKMLQNRPYKLIKISKMK